VIENFIVLQPHRIAERAQRKGASTPNNRIDLISKRVSPERLWRLIQNPRGWRRAIRA